MTSEQKQHAHFKGKKAIEHVIEARKKGRNLVEEMHGIELSGFPFTFMDAIRETVIFLLIIGLTSWFFSLSLPWVAWLGVIVAFLVWKTIRCSLNAWSRLERFHRLIEEERWEIEHHRDQEKEELVALYKAKGFTPPLLDQVIDVLMADDNRLLQVMLEEELGLPLENFDHPLKQGFGSFLGASIAGAISFLSYYFFSFLGLSITAAFLFVLSSYFIAKWGKNLVINAIFWQTGGATLTFFILYFFLKTLTRVI